MSTTGRAQGIQCEMSQLSALGSVLQLINPVLIQQRRDSQLLWKNYLQENNKADSLLLAFSPLGEGRVMMLTISVLAMMLMMHTIIDIHTQSKQNKT